MDDRDLERPAITVSTDSPPGQGGNDGKPPLDELAWRAFVSLPETVRGLPPDIVREAIRFHRWLEGRLADLRRVRLSFVDADLPDAPVHHALSKCAGFVRRVDDR